MHAAEETDIPIRPFYEVSDYKNYFDVADYTKRLFGMFGGKIEEVELKCSKDMLEQVLDRFGENIFISKLTDKSFNFTYSAAVSDALVTWIINFGNKIEAVKPEQLRTMIKNRINSLNEIYGD